MRRIYLLLLTGILFAAIANGQVSSANYSFSTVTTGSLVDMSSGTTQLLAANTDDGASVVTNIGFDFWFMGVRYTQFSASSNGFVGLGGTAVQTNYALAATAAPLIAACGSDLFTSSLAGASAGKVHYKLTGSAPNRVLVIEFLNEAIIYLSGGASSDGTFQVKLSESTGQIEFVYGAMNRNASTGFSGGMQPQFVGFSTNNAVANSFATVTTSTNTVNTTGAAASNQYTLGAAIPNLNSVADGSRRVYTFIPPAPADPTGLSFTTVTATGMTLNWADNATNEVGYVIYRSDDGGTTYNVITQTLANAITYVASGLSPGITYFWKVVAVTEGRLSNALSGSQATNPPGNIVSTGNGNWSSTTPDAPWPGGIVPAVTDNVTIADGSTVTIDITTATCNNLIVGQGTSGILTWVGGATAATLSVASDVTVAVNGTFDPGAGTGTKQLNIGGSATTLQGGNLTVNGSFNMAASATVFVSTTFFGSLNGSISGSGTTCNFYTITVNKGTSASSILDVTRVITVLAPTTSSSRLVITNGTFKMSSASTITPYFGSNTICAATGRLWLNNSSASIQSVGAGTSATGAGSPTVTGELRIDNGTFAYGQGNNTMTVSTGTGILRVNGGTLNMYGAISFASNAGCQFIMSGGNINVDPQNITNIASSTTLFTIGASTTVNWSGGIITIVDPHAAAAGVAWSAATGGSKTITGGTLRIGDGISTTTGGTLANNSGFGITSSMGIWNLEINNRTDASTSRMARISGSTTVLNQIEIKANGYLFTGNTTTANTIILIGNLINDGILAGTEPGGTQSIGTVQYSGTVAQSVTGAGTFVNNGSLSMANTSTGLTLSQTNQYIVSRVNFFFAGGITNANKITLGLGGATTSFVQYGQASGVVQAGTFDVTPVFNVGSGGLSLLYLQEPVTRTTGLEIPASRNVGSLTINNTNGVTLAGGNLNLVGGTNPTLTMAAGNLGIGSNNLSLGASATVPGTLTYTTGLINVTTGTFTRWFGTTGLPTTAGTGIGFYPLGSSGNNRAANIYFSTATALTTGGTITVSHADAAGVTGVSVLDGAYLIDKRVNASWTFAQSGLVAGGTIGTRLSAGGLTALNGVITSNTNLRLMQSASVAGTFVASSYSLPNFRVERTGLSVANIANTHYIGASNADIPILFTAINTGNWSTPGTWDQGSAPGASDPAAIATGVNVTTDATAPNVCSMLTINSGATLTSNTATLAVGNNITNNGTFLVGGSIVNVTGLLVNTSVVTVSAGTLNVVAAGTTGITNAATTGIFTVSGGTVNLGITDNTFCNRTFSNSGTLTVSSGALNVYGNIVSASGSTFNQSGGNIKIDGNAGGSAANSVVSGTSLLQFNQTNSGINLTGGTLTIVDPHANSTASNVIGVNNGTAGAQTSTAAHNTQFGDGVSTDAGGNVAGFRVDPWSNTTYLQLGSVVIMGPGGTNRMVTYAYQMAIKGNVTVNSGGNLNLTDPDYGSLFIGGDLTVNAGGTFTNVVSLQTQTLASNSSLSLTLTAGTNTQTISGAGTFQNLAASPTANLANLTINNTNATGVTVGAPLSVSGTLTLTQGIVNTTPTNLLRLGTATAPGTLAGGSPTAYIKGPFARTFAASRSAAGTYDVTTLYPVGKGTTYLPMYIDPATTAVGPVILQAEAFDAATGGTPGAGMASLNSTDYWNASVVSGGANLTNATVRLTDAGIGSADAIAKSATQTGSYNYIGGNSVGIPANTITSDAFATFSYFVMGVKAAITCTPPTITAPVIVPNCGSGQWSYTVDVTSLGSATSLSFSGAVGSPATVTTVPTTVTFGPFASGSSSPIVTVIHNLDILCNSTIAAQSYLCNDLCTGALPIPCGGSLSGNTTNATDDALPAITCGSTTPTLGNNKGVWFTITPAFSGSTTISTCTGTDWDTYLRVYEGACGSFTTCVGFDDDGCSESTYGLSQFTFTAVGGTTYYILMGGYGAADFGAYTISVTCPAACAAPPQPTMSAITSTTATATWAGAGSFILEYGPTTYTPGTGAAAGAGGTLIDPAVSPQAISGLTASTTYDLYVRQLCAGPVYSANSPVRTFTTSATPPANDDAPGAIALTVGAGCTGAIYSNVGATASASEVFPSCSGTIASPVWFKFVAPASGAVRISTDLGSGNTFTDSKVGLFSIPTPADVANYSLFTIISCDEDGGSALGLGFMSVVYATGLTPGTTYYVAVDKFDIGSTNGQFCIAVDELNSSMLATSGSCTSGQDPFGDNAYTGWQSLVDENSKLIALVKNPAGGAVEDYTVSQNINGASVRSDAVSGQKYLDRSYHISNTTATNVQVQFFFLSSELTALQSADAATTLANLGVTRQTEDVSGCHGDFDATNGVETYLTQTGNGTSADGLVKWIGVTTPGFSNFYLHTSKTPVTLKTFLQGAYLGAGTHKNVSATWLAVLQANATSQPYGVAPFNYTGTESVPAGTFTATASGTDILDWVLLELRDATTPSVIVKQRAAFILVNGSIVDLDKVSSVSFRGVANGSYYITIRHRNHLDIRTGLVQIVDGALGSNPAPALYDFTTAQAQAYQNTTIAPIPTNTAMKNLASGVFGMWGGNVNPNLNTVVNYTGLNNDALAILAALGGNQGLNLTNVYSRADVNMTGNVNYTGLNNDALFLLAILGGNQGGIVRQHVY